MPSIRKQIEAAKAMHRANPLRNPSAPRGRPYDEEFVDIAANMLILAYGLGYDPTAILRMVNGHAETETESRKSQQRTAATTRYGHPTKNWIEAAKAMYQAYPFRNPSAPRGRPSQEEIAGMVKASLLWAHSLGYDPAAILRMAAQHVETSTEYMKAQQQAAGARRTAGPCC